MIEINYRDGVPCLIKSTWVRGSCLRGRECRRKIFRSVNTVPSNNQTFHDRRMADP